MGLVLALGWVAIISVIMTEVAFFPTGVAPDFKDHGINILFLSLVTFIIWIGA